MHVGKMRGAEERFYQSLEKIQVFDLRLNMEKS